MSRRNCSGCGQDFDALKKAAITKDFRPVAFNAKGKIDIKQQVRSFKSHNVIGKLEGSDPKLKNEYVIYTAHWDHLGRHPELQGDQIFNGAVDNASGRRRRHATRRRIFEIKSAAEAIGPVHVHDRGGSGLVRRQMVCRASSYPLGKRWLISTSTA